MSRRPVFVTRALLPPREEYVQMIGELWDSHMLTNYGSLHNRFEAALKQRLEVPYLSLCANGHLALESVMQTLALKGEVITTPFTFVSTANAIVRCGLTPVFCDIRESDYTIDPEKLEPLITEHTCAILAVHVYGTFCQREAIEAIARKHGLYVIYDAAHCFGVRVPGGWAAGDGISVLSFHATKVFNSGEGGAVAVQSPELALRLHLNHNHGLCDADASVWPGGNAKLSELHAAMGLCNLEHVEEEIRRRGEIFDRYQRRLAGIPALKLPQVPEGVQSNFAYFPVVFRQGKQMRERVFAALAQRDIHARRYFYPLIPDHPGLKAFGSGEAFPVAKRISDGILCLPIHGGLEPDDVEEICAVIRNCLQVREA